MLQRSGQDNLPGGSVTAFGWYRLKFGRGAARPFKI